MKITKLLISFLLLALLIQTGASEEYHFTTCGDDGRNGPSEEDCNQFYSGDNEVEVEDNGIQVWEVPQSGIYRITAYGAEGASNGGSGGGLGAEISGEFEFESGEEIRIIAGQEGFSSTRDSAGGGASYVYEDEFDDPYIVAGGGGGGTNTGSTTNIQHGQTSTSGADGMVCANAGDGGTGGDGGESSSGNSHGGGAGWIGQGAASGGYPPRDGAQGGSDSYDGGFGGGGAASTVSGYSYAGGGGGYSGGGVSRCTSSGGTARAGGGGSFNTGTDTQSSSGENSGEGEVFIELVTNPNDPVIQTPIEFTDTEATSSNSAIIEGEFDVEIFYDDGLADDNELESCSVTGTGQDNGGSASASTTVNNDDSCDFDIDNNDHSNWEPGETIEFDIEVEDSYGGTDTLTRSHSFVNTAPETVEVSVDDNDIYGDEVWGGEGGITLEAEVEDYESITTNSDIDVEFQGDLGVITQSTISNGDGTTSIDWERAGADDMYGFNRGGIHDKSVLAIDGGGEMNSDGGPFTVLAESDMSDPSPVDGDGSEYLEIDIDNPAVDEDANVDDTDVEFWIIDGGDEYEYDVDENVENGETASVSIEDFVLENEEGSWYVVADDGYSRTSYAEVDYQDNTEPPAAYEFNTGSPEILSGNPDGDTFIDTEDVELSTTIEQEEGHQYDIEIYLEGELVKEVEEINTQTYTADVGNNEIAEHLPEPGHYEWSVYAENENTLSDEEVFSFEILTGESFRLGSRLDYAYDSVIKGEDETQFVDLEVNDFTGLEREAELEIVSNIDASLSDDVVDFSEDSSQTVSVEIREEEVGRHDLIIEIRDTELGALNTEQLPVYVRESETVSTNRVPGLGLPYMLFVLIMATLVFAYKEK